MKLNQYITGLFAGISILMFAACNDFLDKAPDNRTEINTPKQVYKLLTSGYFVGNYAALAELSGDNIVDNNAPHYDEKTKKTIYYNLGSFERMDDEIFAWEPAVSSVDKDSPSAVWEGCYNAIAVANHALQAIDRLEKEGQGAEVAAAKGEALLIRAYNHFILVNIFCQAYRNDELSNDKNLAMGIPYVTDPETKVSAHYDRGTVTEVYNKIEKDLLEGLPLVADIGDPSDRYHFNKKAANAFAARFYLYKRNWDNVIKYASMVFDGDPSGSLRNYVKYDDMSTVKAKSYEWISGNNENNFLLVSTYCLSRRFWGGYRYSCNHEAASATLYGFGPTWYLKPHPCLMSSGMILNGIQEYGLYPIRSVEIFEYTDKVAGIGLPHVVRCEFTAEETLLCRAEAYIHKNDYGNALADLKAYDDSRQRVGGSHSQDFVPLTDERIREYYDKNNTKDVDAKYAVLDYNTEKMSPDFVITPEQKPYIDCLLHFRRIETILDGYRWFDIKRYGLEIEHAIGGGKNAVVKRLTWDDPRRALQIPQEVIAAGMAESYRLEAPTGEPTLLTPSFVKYLNDAE